MASKVVNDAGEVGRPTGRGRDVLQRRDEARIKTSHWNKSLSKSTKSNQNWGSPNLGDVFILGSSLMSNTVKPILTTTSEQQRPAWISIAAYISQTSQSVTTICSGPGRCTKAWLMIQRKEIDTVEAAA